MPQHGGGGGGLTRERVAPLVPTGVHGVREVEFVSVRRNRARCAVRHGVFALESLKECTMRARARDAYVGEVRGGYVPS